MTAFGREEVRKEAERLELGWLPGQTGDMFLIGKLAAFLMPEMALVPDREQSACFKWLFTIMFPHGNIGVML